MSITREEFCRLLRAAVGPFEARGDVLMSAGTDPRWTIRLVALPDRQLGSVVVPRYRVEIAVEAPSAAGAAAFMARVRRGFLRGGG